LTRRKRSMEEHALAQFFFKLHGVSMTVCRIAMTDLPQPTALRILLKPL
jgi:hypothetical protein